MTITATYAIEDSVMTNQTIHLPIQDDSAVVLDLMAACDDWTEANTETEFWGTSDSGSSWRVHVARPPRSRSGR